jgi:hypothetical protein
MKKIAYAIFTVVVGAFTLGLVASTFYVFYMYPGQTAEHVKYYAGGPIRALILFIVNPYAGSDIATDDVYIRNIIFGFSIALVAAGVYRRL